MLGLQYTLYLYVICICFHTNMPQLTIRDDCRREELLLYYIYLPVLYERHISVTLEMP